MTLYVLLAGILICLIIIIRQLSNLYYQAVGANTELTRWWHERHGRDNWGL